MHNLSGLAIVLKFLLFILCNSGTADHQCSYYMYAGALALFSSVFSFDLCVNREPSNKWNRNLCMILDSASVLYTFRGVWSCGFIFIPSMMELIALAAMGCDVYMYGLVAQFPPSSKYKSGL